VVVLLLLEGLHERLDDLIVDVLELGLPHEGDRVVLEQRRILPIGQEDLDPGVDLPLIEAVREGELPHTVREELVDEVPVRIAVLIDDLVEHQEVVGRHLDDDRLGHPKGRLERVEELLAEGLDRLVFPPVQRDGPDEFLELGKHRTPELDHRALLLAEGLLTGSLEELHDAAAALRLARPVGILRHRLPRRTRRVPRTHRPPGAARGAPSNAG
jgi:hypothetical protein